MLPPKWYDDFSLPAELPREPVVPEESRFRAKPRNPRRRLGSNLFLSARNIPWLKYFEDDRTFQEKDWRAIGPSAGPKYIQDQIQMLNLESAQSSVRRVVAVLWDSAMHFMPSVEFQFDLVKRYVAANSDILLWDGEIDTVVQMVEFYNQDVSPRRLEFIDFVMHFCNDHTHVVYPTIAFVRNRMEYLQLPLLAACKGKTTAILDHSIDTLRFPEQLAISAAVSYGMRSSANQSVVLFAERLGADGPEGTQKEQTNVGFETAEDIFAEDGVSKVASKDIHDFVHRVWNMARQTYQPATYDTWTVRTMKKTQELQKFDPSNKSRQRRQIVLQIALDIVTDLGVPAETRRGRLVRAMLCEIADRAKPSAKVRFKMRKRYIGVYRHVTIQSMQEKRRRKLMRTRMNERLKRRIAERRKNYDPVANARYRRDRYEERLNKEDRVARVYKKQREKEEREKQNGETQGVRADDAGGEQRSSSAGNEHGTHGNDND